MRPIVLFCAALGTPLALGFVQPNSSVRPLFSSTRRSALNEGVRSGLRSFLVGDKRLPSVSQNVPPIDPTLNDVPPLPVNDNPLDSLVSRLFEKTAFNPPKLSAFLSDPGSIGGKIGAEVDEWGEMFRVGADRSWLEVGGGFRESASESANLLFQASKNSVQYFITEFAASWESSTETRRVLGEEGKLLGDSLRDLGPYVQSNTAASWESSTPLREGAQQVAVSVVPFVERCFSYFASNAAISWDTTGYAWRDDVVQTTSSSVQDFGPYFLSNLLSSWEASEPIRPAVGCLLVGSWLVLQLRQRKGQEIAAKQKATVGSNALYPFLQSSVSNVQAAVDKTAKNISVRDFQEKLLRTTTLIPKAAQLTSKKPEAKRSMTTFLGVSASPPRSVQMDTKKAQKGNPLTFLGTAVPQTKKGVSKIRAKKKNTAAKKQASFSFK